MKFLSLQPFVPSGSDFESSKKLFSALGFDIRWDAGDYVSFDKDGCRFILQKFNNREFAENFMITVNVSNAEEFRKMVLDKKNTGSLWHPHRGSYPATLWKGSKYH